MGNVLLLQLDGKLPNLALMRTSQHHRRRGDQVFLRRAMNRRAPTLDPVAVLQREFDEPSEWSAIYASAIFTRSSSLVGLVKAVHPTALVGGTGVDVTSSLEAHGIPDNTPPDYSIYPRFTASMGFTQRGCRLKCSFCVVPKKEGPVREELTIAKLWRGEPWPRHLVLLDNDFFGNPHWQARVAEIRDGNFRVNFCQGINARMLTDETAEAIASVLYYDTNFKSRRLYTAWDNKKDEQRLFRGLESLVRYGVKPGEIMVYILIGYWPGETRADWEYRRARLRAFGAVPYPMPYVRTTETVAFYRWVVGAYDKKCTWRQWEALRFQSRNYKFGQQNLGGL
jgi:hypothetical protein